jgi:hypothetical protein
VLIAGHCRGADRRRRRSRIFGAPPRGILPLQPDDQLLDRLRELVGVPLRPAAAVREPLDPAALVPAEDLVTGLPGDPELGAEPGHLLAVEQPADEADALVHDVTLLPRHAPSLAKRARVSPMSPV